MSTPEIDVSTLTPEEALWLLASVRAGVTTVTDFLTTAKEVVAREFETRHEARLAEQARLLQAQAALEAYLREQALAHFAATGDKQPFNYLGIRVTTGYAYAPDQALEWGKKHGLCLSLDAKAFKDLCKADSTRPAFVTVEEVPTATIATDLSALLEPEVQS